MGIFFKLMALSQMQAEPDVSRETSSWKLTHAVETEKSRIKMEIARSAYHTPELNKTTLSASQTNAVTTKSSHGSELVLTVKKEPHQMRTEEAALDQLVYD